MGAAIVMGLLLVVLFVIFTVAIIAAVGLGIIGIGYSAIKDEED